MRRRRESRPPPLPHPREQGQVLEAALDGGRGGPPCPLAGGGIHHEDRRDILPCQPLLLLEQALRLVDGKVKVRGQGGRHPGLAQLVIELRHEILGENQGGDQDEGGDHGLAHPVRHRPPLCRFHADTGTSRHGARRISRPGPIHCISFITRQNNRESTNPGRLYTPCPKISVPPGLRWPVMAGWGLSAWS
ncbi:MAG: hypothetical protein RLZZ165_1456 [Bacteroidota bacterium]